MQDEVFARYQVPPERRGYYTIDHLIPVELGGADLIKNLWPQLVDARPYGPTRKQLLTRKLLQLVAGNQLTLAEAQHEISDDWISSFVMRIGMVYLSPNIGAPGE